MNSNYTDFIKQAQPIFQDRLYADYLRRFAYGIDASCYRYIPQIVVKPKDEREIQTLFELSKRFNTPLTFRAAGTSLSGQTCGEGVLVIANNLSWQNMQIHENAESITLSCGVIGSEANLALKPFGKKIGPDPATINNAMIGGIFSNNSSGMCCGVKQNSYQTIKSIRVVLYDGFILDTSDQSSLQEFISTHQDIVQSLMQIRKEILADDELASLIRRKFAIKNTTGYGINSLLDFDDIKDILNHIFIGAEGTLGFVSEVTYHCVDDYPHKACALLFYENLQESAKAIKILANHESIVSAAEIMDYACLKSVSHLEGIPDVIKNIQEGTCCLLIQLESNDEATLKQNIDTIKNALKETKNLFDINFSFDAKEQQSWWKIRKGILPIAAATRRKGSTVITEDICFEIEHFANGIGKITDLFHKHQFEGIIFGHALSGNVHFIITPLLDDEIERESFGCFMDDMVDVVVSLGGSTKAEHGTGRMMAPFVEKEWGKKAYEINKKIKKIFDPHSLINPDVIICDNPNIHLQNLKPSSEVEDFINQCMECGFCEKVCPSKDLTLTPRQRIAVRKEIARLESIEHKSQIEQEELESLKQDYHYFAIDTCATCSMCASICPLEIDTAKIALMVKPSTTSTISNFIAQKTSEHFKATTSCAKTALSLAHKSLSPSMIHKVRQIRPKIKCFIQMPHIPDHLPRPNHYPLLSKTNSNHQRQVLYFSTCLNRAFAPHHSMNDQRSIQEVFENICKKAHIDVIYPDNLNQLCCGKAYKDYPEVSHKMALKTYESLLTIAGTQMDIVCDHSACSLELMKNVEEFAKQRGVMLRIYDMPQYIAQVLLERLSITPLEEDIGLYAMCATKKGKWDHTLYQIAQRCTKGEIISHHKTQCCGFAGNKGFTTPELNESALQELSQFFSDKKIKKGFASSSTCEIGLSDKTGFPWQNIIYLVDACSQESENNV